MDKKMLPVDSNDISVSVTGNTNKKTSIQDKIWTCRSIQNRKHFCIILFSTIIITLIILSIIIPTIIVLKKTKDISTVVESTTDLSRPPTIQTSASTSTIKTTTETKVPFHDILSDQTKWNENGITFAGGNGYGNGLHQLNGPRGMYVDDDQTVYVSEPGVYRIVQWKCNAKYGEIVANTKEHAEYGLFAMNFIIDTKKDSFIICDPSAKEVIQWPRVNGTTGQIIISNIACLGLAMDNESYLYVSDMEKHEVRRWNIGNPDGMLVAGGNKQGKNLNQLDTPTYIFIDQNNSLYISDSENYRVVKWIIGEKEGTVVAQGQSEPRKPTQMNVPAGLTVDYLGNIYVVDMYNNRIMRWIKGATRGTIIIGKHGFGGEANQLRIPTGLSFDRFDNLIVLDIENLRVQKFCINSNLNCSCS